MMINLKIIIISSLILLLSSVNVEALTLEVDDIIKPNATSLGYYVINYTTDFSLVEINGSSALFRSITGLPHYCYDVDTSVQLCTKAVTCIIPQTDIIRNINFSDIGGASGGTGFSEYICIYDNDCKHGYECVKFKCKLLSCKYDEKLSSDGHSCKPEHISYSSEPDYSLYYLFAFVLVLFIVFLVRRRKKKREKKKKKKRHSNGVKEEKRQGI